MVLRMAVATTLTQAPDASETRRKSLLAESDELRLLVLPRAPLPGLVGLEIGLAWEKVATGYTGSLEVLVRVHDGSAAAARMTALAPHARPLTGRKTDERVVRLSPRLPGTVADLTLRLAQELAREMPPDFWSDK